MSDHTNGDRKPEQTEFWVEGPLLDTPERVARFVAHMRWLHIKHSLRFNGTVRMELGPEFDEISPPIIVVDQQTP